MNIPPINIKHQNEHIEELCQESSWQSFFSHFKEEDLTKEAKQKMIQNLLNQTSYMILKALKKMKETAKKWKDQ